MRGAIELSDVHDIALVLQDGCFVVVYVEVVGGREDCHYRRETCGFCLPVHSVAEYLSEVVSRQCMGVHTRHPGLHVPV